MLKVFQVVARSVLDHGVDTMFGVIGDANLYLADAFAREMGGRFVPAAHEAGAAMMALGYAAVSGRTGVATATHGPGLSNAVTPLIEGAKGGVPMVLLCGDTPVGNASHLQDIPQRALVEATGAGFEQLRSPATACEDVAKAFRRAASERRPIVLNMPAEFQWNDAVYEKRTVRPIDRGFATTTGPQFDDAIGIIAAAKAPIVLAGRGASNPDAKTAILRLADRTNALLATTVKAKGLFDGEAFNLGILGTLSDPATVDLVLRSDCIVSFGASLNSHSTSHGTFLKDKRLVQVEQDPGWIGRNVTPDAGVVGDPAMMADLFRYWLDEAGIEPSGFRTDDIRQMIAGDVRSAKLHPRHTGDGTIDLREALSHIDRQLPAERVFVTDGGRFVFEAWRSIGVQAPHLFVSTLNFGCIGLGMGAAIGASIAAPDRTTLLVTGDGGFMLGGLSELNSAVRSKRDLVIVVCNDGSYGAEHVQFRQKGMDPALSLFDWPDFASVANALGAKGITVRNTADFPIVSAAIDSPVRPLLIDLKLDPDAMPDVPH